jgi:hypothetical protein
MNPVTYMVNVTKRLEKVVRSAKANNANVTRQLKKVKSALASAKKKSKSRR